MKPLIITQEDIDGYTPHLKDTLSRIYKYVIRHQEKDKLVNFTIEGINVVQRRLYGEASVRLSEKFVANLDVMKRIADEQTSYKITHTFNNTEENGGIKIEEEIVFGYDREKVYYIAGLKYRNASKPWYELKIDRIN